MYPVKLRLIHNQGMKHTISILVENEFGALARIAGLFSGRGYNIESLTVAPTLDPSLSRMTINTQGSDAVTEQLIKQLNKLISVVKVKDVSKEAPVSLSLALIKVNLGKRNREKLKLLLKNYDSKVIDSDDNCSIVQVVADDEGLSSLVEKLKPYGIMEYLNTGNVAMQKGKQAIK